MNQRQTISETFRPQGAGFKEMGNDIIGTLRIMSLRLPKGATPLPLPADFPAHYKREIHARWDEDGHFYEAIEIAIHKVEEPNGDIIYEYSTDYELAEPEKPIIP
jgi:hypothetical protein